MLQKARFTGIRVYDPIEKRLPNLGIIPIKDSETGIIKWVSTFPKTGIVFKKSRDQVKAFEEILKKMGQGK